MSIILLILKIVGILLLVLLGCLLFLILIVLFVPIRYEINWEYYAENQYQILVNWLLHIVTYQVNSDEQMPQGLRIFGFVSKEKKTGKKKVEEDKLYTEDDFMDASDEGIETPKESDDTITEDIYKKDTLENDISERDISEIDVSEKDISGKDIPEPDTMGEKPLRKTARKKRKSKQKSMKGKINPSKAGKKAKDFFQKAKDFLENDSYMNAIKLIKKQAFWLLKKCFPKKLQLQATYSLGSPDDTGIVFGVIAMFPVAYQNKWAITPDFESDKIYAKGQANIKGKILIYHIVKAIWPVVWNKDCQKLYKDWKE